MDNIKNKKIVFVGSGNLATHLSLAFKYANNNIIQIYSRKKQNAELLANQINCSFTNNLKKLNPEGDIYILAVSDNAINTVLKKINLKNKLLIHTSGSTNISVLKSHSDNFGVFYPLQTFSKNKELNFKNIPVCIEANNKLNEQILFNLAKQISDDIHYISSEKRIQLHLAAVFVSNFVNHLYSIADNILTDNDLPFNLLKPLISETANKVIKNKPVDCQTGPAIRNDKNVIKTHLRLLNKFPIYKKIYTFVSKSIFNLHKSNIKQ